jgi:hexulose-6-phosphate isomerase
MSDTNIGRRGFLGRSLATAGAVALGAPSLSRGAVAPKLKKAVKYGMIGEGKTILEKFQLIKSIGFDGVEMDSPADINREEVVAARDESGIVIHGVVCSTHWGVRMSDPKEEVRAKAVTNFRTALEDTKTYGGTTTLLVPGAVRDPKKENFDQCWERSTACVKQLIPDAKRLGVKIAIETVWNDFITTPEQLIKYVDQFESEYVAAYFDISNMLKYGVPAAEWVRKLGKRMAKFDFKGYSLERAKEKGNAWEGFNVPIGEGSENWPEVLKALEEVGYEGFATSEVGGGGRKKLEEIARRMDKVLGIKG